MKLIKVLRVICGIVLLVGLPGCSGKIGYNFGFITHSVIGKIEKESTHTFNSETFIIVKEHIRTFMSTSEGDLHRIGAKIVKVDKNGNYEVPYSSKVSQVDLYYLSEGHYMDSESFRKTLFVGSYEYNPVLEANSNFKSSYYFSIKPMLSELITETRYKLPLQDQVFIENWMNQMDDNY